MAAFKLMIAAGLVVAVSGCTSLGGATPTIDNATLEGGAGQAIAGDLAAHLTLELGQGRPTLVLDGKQSDFAASLEEALRQKGYALASKTVAGTETVALGYVVEPFEDGVLVRLALPALSLGRAYRLQQGTAQPNGPVVIMRAQP